MKIITLISFLILFAGSMNGQNLIGLNDNEIRKYMKEYRKDMNIENVRNDRFKYLKYSDNFDSQTILFFLNEDSFCKSVRVILDTSRKSEKVNELNSTYKKSGENQWIDNHDGKNYLITMKDEKWSCIISIDPDK